MIVKSRREALDAQVAKYIQQSKALSSAGHVGAALSYAQKALALRQQINALPASPTEPVADYVAVTVDHVATNLAEQAVPPLNEAFPASATPGDKQHVGRIDDDACPQASPLSAITTTTAPQSSPANRTRNPMDHAFNAQLDADGIPFSVASMFVDDTPTSPPTPSASADGREDALNALLWPDEIAPEAEIGRASCRERV